MSTESLPKVDQELTKEQFTEQRSDYGNPIWAHRTLQNGTLEKVLAHRHQETGKVAYVKQ